MYWVLWFRQMCACVHGADFLVYRHSNQSERKVRMGKVWTTEPALGKKKAGVLLMKGVPE